MTVSASSLGLVLLAGLVAGSALAQAQAQAQAQVGPPVRLVPPPPSRSAEPPPPPPGPLGPGLQPLPLPLGETVPRPPAVRVDPLQAPDPSNVGLLDPGKGGFPLDMWRGTRLATVQALMPRLPAAAPSPVMQDLMRRLLLSGAPPPSGPSAGPSLLGMRVERLAAAGRIADMNDLLKAAGSRLEDPALAVARIDAALLAGDNEAACAGAKDEMAKRPRPEIAKVAAFCQAAAGEKAAANLAGDLLREQGQKDDAFFALLDQLTGARKVAKLGSLKQPTPLHLAMLRQARQQIPEDAVREATPAVLRAIADSSNASPDMRVEAAERAEAAGALTAAELAQFYSEAKLSPDAKRNPRHQAAAYQAAQSETEDGKKLEALRRALAQARADGRFASAARLWRETAMAIPATGALEAGAGDMARLLIAVGEHGRAKDWLAFDRNAQAQLWPLQAIAEGGRGQGWNAARLGEWLAANDAREGTPEQKDRRAQLLFALLEALGYQVGAAEWDKALAGPARVAGEGPSAPVWRALRQSAMDRKLGETVLSGLVAIGDGGPAKAHPVVLATTIEALRSVRLENDARALALEAALSGGL